MEYDFCLRLKKSNPKRILKAPITILVIIGMFQIIGCRSVTQNESNFPVAKNDQINATNQKNDD